MSPNRAWGRPDLCALRDRSGCRWFDHRVFVDGALFVRTADRVGRMADGDLPLRCGIGRNGPHGYPKTEETGSHDNADEESSHRPENIEEQEDS